MQQPHHLLAESLPTSRYLDSGQILCPARDGFDIGVSALVFIGFYFHFLKFPLNCDRIDEVLSLLSSLLREAFTMLPLPRNTKCSAPSRAC
jgi:hypothetical protein